MSDTTIDKILIEVLTRTGNYKEAKSALYDLILKEVVGEDVDPVDHWDEKQPAVDTIMQVDAVNNKLAEQRNKLKGIFK